jgi:hypothetical protein
MDDPDRTHEGRAEHIVPLTDHAWRIVERCIQLRCVGTDLLFYANRPRGPMSDMTLVKVLRDMGEPFTAHGFRSAFRDWASETTDFPDRVTGGELRTRALVIQQKTGRPVQFEIMSDARGSLFAWLERRGGSIDDYAFPGRFDHSAHMSTRQYACLVDEWVLAEAWRAIAHREVTIVNARLRGEAHGERLN